MMPIFRLLRWRMEIYVTCLLVIYMVFAFHCGNAWYRNWDIEEQKSMASYVSIYMIFAVLFTIHDISKHWRDVKAHLRVMWWKFPALHWIVKSIVIIILLFQLAVVAGFIACAVMLTQFFFQH